MYRRLMNSQFYKPLPTHPSAWPVIARTGPRCKPDNLNMLQLLVIVIVLPCLLLLAPMMLMVIVVVEVVVEAEIAGLSIGPDRMTLGICGNDEKPAVGRDTSRASRPPDSNLLQPSIDFFTESSIPSVVPGSKLFREAMAAEEGNSNYPALRGPAFPGEPCVKVEDTGSIRKSGHNPAFNGNSVILDFCEESLAEGNRVLKPVGGREVRSSVTAVPEAKLIKEVKPRPIKKDVLTAALVRSEKDRATKDALEGGCDSLVIETCGRKIEIAQELGKMVKLDRSAFLAERKRCDPDWDQAVLPIRKPEFGMAYDCQGEVAVSTSVRELARCGPPQRESAQDKRPGIERELLLAISPLLADEAN